MARSENETYVGTSIRFRLPGLTVAQCQAVLSAATARGVELKWSGVTVPGGFASSSHNWRYVRAQALPETDRILAKPFDMRLPFSFSRQDCSLIATLISEPVAEAAR